MTEVVKVSSIEKMEELKGYIAEQFDKGHYAEITQAVGMHSLLVDPGHTMKDQAGLYRQVLNLMKKRITARKGRLYGAWYSAFPKLMDELIVAKQIVTDHSCLDVLSSHREAYGEFKSLDDFFVWALDDRRLALDEIVKYIEATAEKHK